MALTSQPVSVASVAASCCCRSRTDAKYGSACVHAFGAPAHAWRSSPAMYWIALAAAWVATYALLAPAAAALSATFPKTIDLNSIGNSGNAHQAAGLLGMLSFVVSVAPSVVLAVLAIKFLQRRELVPWLLGGWCVIALGLSYLLFIPVARFVASRRENLAQYY